MGPNNLRVPKLDAVSILHKLGSRSRFRLPRNENTVQSLDYIEYKTETTRGAAAAAAPTAGFYI